MLSKARDLFECFATDLTCIRSFSGVNPFVGLKSGALIESLSAYLTHVGSFARMDALVNLQSRCIAECFRAIGAGERPLACMHTFMHS